MEFSILKQDLIKPLTMAASIAMSAKGTKTYFQNILLKLSEDDGLTMICVNNESEMKVTIPLEKLQVVSYGEISVVAKNFQEICKLDLVRKRKSGSEEDRIFFSFNESSGKVQVKRFTNIYEINTLPANSFPQNVSCTYECEFDLTEGELKDIIKTTQFSMAEGDSRIFLNGLFMHLKGNELFCIATDSHRLALNKFILLDRESDYSSVDFKVIIGRTGIQEINKLISSCDNPIHISMSRTKIKFESNDFCFVTSLIEGDYPDHNRLFPREDSFKGRLTVNCEDLKNAVKAVTVLGGSSDEKMILNASEDKVFLNLKNSSHESAEVFIENVQYQGVASRIGLNPRFLLNILDNISCKSITLSFNDSASVIDLNEKNNYCEMRFIVMLVVI